MKLIKVPKPPASAMNKDRPISSLLKTQLLHVQKAEFRLPARAQTNIYINAIKTEGEAAEYIRQVTTNLHKEHATPAVKPRRRLGKAKKGVFEIAAAAATKRNSGAQATAPPGQNENGSLPNCGRGHQAPREVQGGTQEEIEQTGPCAENKTENEVAEAGCVTLC